MEKKVELYTKEEVSEIFTIVLGQLDNIALQRIVDHEGKMLMNSTIYSHKDKCG